MSIAEGQMLKLENEAGQKEHDTLKIGDEIGWSVIVGHSCSTSQLLKSDDVYLILQHQWCNG